MATWQWSGDIELGSSGQRLVTGTGDPEGVITAPIGSIYFRADGGTNTTVYIKEGGSGNTGWTSVGAGGSTITLRNNTVSNSLQNLLDLTDGNGITITDLGSGQIQFNGPAFKHDGVSNTFQAILDLRSGTNISVADIGSGRIQITALPQVAIQVNGTPAASQTTLNLVSGTNITLADLGSGSIRITSTGGTSAVRATASHTTASIASGTYEETTITLAKSFHMVKIVANNYCRVEIYETNAQMVADRTRPFGTFPLVGTPHGVLGDWLLNTPSYIGGFDCSPPIEGSNMEISPSANISIRVTNVSGITTSVTVTFTYVPVET